MHSVMCIQSAWGGSEMHVLIALKSLTVLPPPAPGSEKDVSVLQHQLVSLSPSLGDSEFSLHPPGSPLTACVTAVGKSPASCGY